MKRTCIFLFATASLGASAWAQVTATATIREGCTEEAPHRSLVAKPDSPLTFLPAANDLVVIQAENPRPLGSWKQESILPGYTGCGYLRWDGPDLFNQPGVGSPLPYRFEIKTAGDYLVRLYVRHDNPNEELENDCWIRMDGGPWDRMWNNYGPASVGVWNWESKVDSTLVKPRFTLDVGTHVFEIAGRSRQFKIDRIHIFPQVVFGTTTVHPESSRKEDRPLLGTTFSVEMDDSCGQGGLTSGSTLAQWFVTTAPLAGHPCGIPYKGQEILIRIAPPPISAGPAQVWNGKAVTFNAAIPNDIAFLGGTVYTQGVFFNPGSLTLTNALDIVIGDM